MKFNTCFFIWNGASQVDWIGWYSSSPQKNQQRQNTVHLFKGHQPIKKTTQQNSWSFKTDGKWQLLRNLEAEASDSRLGLTNVDAPAISDSPLREHWWVTKDSTCPSDHLEQLSQVCLLTEPNVVWPSLQATSIGRRVNDKNDDHISQFPFSPALLLTSCSLQSESHQKAPKFTLFQPPLNQLG